MKSSLALLVCPLLLVAGCAPKPLPHGTQLFLTDQVNGTPTLTTRHAAASDVAIGWTVSDKGATPRSDYVEVFAVASGPLAGLVGTDPGFGGAPSHAIGWVALSSFPGSRKLVGSNAVRAGQLGDGAHSPKTREAFGYAIADPAAGTV